MKDGELSEDEGHRQMDEIQTMTDDYTKKIDALLKGKEEEVLEV